MDLRYDGLTIRVDIDVQEVIEFNLEQRLNEHAVLRIAFTCKDDVGDAIVKNASEEITIQVYDGRKCAFCGFLSDIRYQGYLGTNRVDAVFYGLSKIFDRTKRRCAVTAEDITYGGLVDKVLESYGKVSCTKTLEDATIPGFLLQYDETDWNFIKRLAGKQGGVLTPDNAASQPAFFFGLPGDKTKEIQSIEGVKVSSLDYEDYGKKAAMNPFGAFLLDSYSHTVRSEKLYFLGEAVKYENVEYRIKEIMIIGKGGIVEKYYTLATENGCPYTTGLNLDYSGLHLEASVDEVSGSNIRVGFQIPEISGGSERFFPYAVESSAWYCMPEVGSKVHIYLPECDETKAYATHSLRNTDAGGANAGATSDPSVKNFTHPSGAAMKLDGSGVHLTSDKDGNATVDLLSDGSLKLKAKTITIHSAGKISIGKGDTSAKNTSVTATDHLVAAINESAAYAYIKDAIFLKGSVINNDATARDAVPLPEAIQHRNDGIEEKINEANNTAKEIEKQKVQEAKKKVGLGVFACVVGAIAIAAVCVCTCGAGLVVVAAVAGTVAIACGASMIAEGAQDYQKAVSSGDFSQSYNFMRDTVCGGNQTLYDILTYGSILVCGIVIAIATGGAAAEVLKKVGIDMLKDVGQNLIMDYIDDGQINNGWEEYFKSACMTGCTCGLSMGATNYIDGLKATGKYACKDISRMRLIADTGIDYLTEFATTGDVNLVKTFLKNYAINKLTVCDPVDAATGSLYIPATDMKLPDIEEDFQITRKYESINPRVGILGLGVISSLESYVKDQGDICSVLCADGHVESFHKIDNAWVNDKAGTKRLELVDSEEGYLMYDKLEKHIYCYSRDGGRLLYVEDKHGNRSKYTYENGVLVEVTTFAGTVIRVTMADGRLRKIEDPMGRTVTYEYDGDHLVSVNQNDRGITRYVFNKAGFISEITDQNNKKYTINTFDSKGRVVHQDYPDGTSCDLEYHDDENYVSLHYRETGGSQKTFHNGEKLVTRIEYQDGTNEQFLYDDRQNKILYSDRNGNARKWEYNDFGQVVKEISPAGLITMHVYNEDGLLVETTDSCGLKETFAYDAKHNLVQKETTSTIDEDAVKCVEKFEYDRFGRLLSKQDGNGNKTTYGYENDAPIALDGKDFKPAWEITPEGDEFRFVYDTVGRKIQAETKLGKETYSYNSLHKVNHRVGGEGNETHDEYDNLGSLIRHYNDRQWKKGGSASGYTYEYDYLDRLIGVTDPLGRKKRYVRNGQGSIIFESLLTYEENAPVAAKGIKRIVDANSNNTETIYPDGSIIKTLYDGEGNLVQKDNPGYFYKYDTENRVTEIKREDGTVEKQFTYDAKGNLIKEVDASGHVIQYAYDFAGRRTAIWECVDRKGMFRVIRFAYDAVGNQISERRGKTAVELGEFPSDYMTIHKAYDKNNRLVKVWDEQGACEEYTYDLRNNRTSLKRKIDENREHVAEFSYDKAGRMNEKREFDLVDSEKTEVSITAYGYDGNSNLTRIVLPEGGIIKMVYDQADRLVQRLEQDRQCGVLRSMTYLYGKVCSLAWEKLYDKANSEVKNLNEYLMQTRGTKAYDYSRIAPFVGRELPVTVRFYGGKAAKKVHQEYVSFYEDGLEWKPERCFAFSNEKCIERHYEYDFRGNVTNYTDVLGNETKYRYNDKGQLLQKVFPDQSMISMEYDVRGNLLARKNGNGQYDFRMSYDAAGQVVSEEDGLGNKTIYHYTETGMQELVGGDDGRTDLRIEFDLWDNPILVEDGNRNQTRCQLDDWGRIIAIYYPDGGIEKYAYNYAGNIVRTEDAIGNISLFSYSGLGRLVSIKRPDGTEKQFAYDKQGRKTYEKNALGNIKLITYNMDDQIVSVAGKPQSSNVSEIRTVFSYDEKGILTDAIENGAHYHYVTDDEGRLLKKVSGGRTLYEVSYDACGRISSLDNAYYKYDGAGQLVSINSDDISVLFEYDNAGRKRKIRYGNGLVTTYDYDSRDQLISLRSVTSDNTELFVASYDYDDNGNRIKKTERALQGHIGEKRGSQKEIAYSYDSCNRLTRESYGESQTISYSYDAAGNRIGMTDGNFDTVYAYNRRNQLTEKRNELGCVSYEYDLTGNLLDEKHYNAEAELLKTVCYEYDAYNRNNHVEINSKFEKTKYEQKNHYDAESLRRCMEETKIEGETTKTDIVDFAYYRGQLISETLSANDLPENKGAIREKDNSRRYLFSDRQFGQTDENGKYYYITDEQDSIRYVINQRGDVVDYRSYYAFGDVAEREGKSITRLGYNSQIADNLTNLYYLRSRFYNSNIGRFTQEDIVYIDGLNLYAYCTNNPVIYDDPEGFGKPPVVNFNLNGFVHEDFLNFDYGKYLKGKIGDPPSWMSDPHAHHILFKWGKGKKQKELVALGQKMLTEMDIDPITGLEVLGWAPNRVKGQHSTATLQSLIDDMKEAYDADDPDAMRAVLKKHQEEAAHRGDDDKAGTGCVTKSGGK